MTVAAAYALNDPLITYAGQGGPAGSLEALVTVDQPNIVIETVKQAEDGQGIIVRFYESQRRRGQITLRTGFDLSQAWHTNLMEENGDAVPVEGRTVTYTVRPYEIVTLRLV
ncbi:MAG: alpha-mannosidase, partial [Anaerolineae bacterium]|nr:alpha-mannosidase [Anaerolineae bacterium]